MAQSSIGRPLDEMCYTQHDGTKLRPGQLPEPACYHAAVYRVEILQRGLDRQEDEREG